MKAACAELRMKILQANVLKHDLEVCPFVLIRLLSRICTRKKVRSRVKGNAENINKISCCEMQARWNSTLQR